MSSFAQEEGDYSPLLGTSDRWSNLNEIWHANTWPYFWKSKAL